MIFLVDFSVDFGFAFIYMVYVMWSLFCNHSPGAFVAVMEFVKLSSTCSSCDLLEGALL